MTSHMTGHMLKALEVTRSVFASSGNVMPLVLSCLHALRLCFLLTLFVRPDHFYRLPDSLRTLPLSRYLAALVSTRLIILTFLFRLRFSCSRCLCLLSLSLLIRIRVSHPYRYLLRLVCYLLSTIDRK